MVTAVKNLKKNIHHLSENFDQFDEKNPTNLVAKNIKIYRIEELKSKNFIEDCSHGHDEINNIKTAINAEILLAIYNNNIKNSTTNDAIKKSWENCHQDVVKDSRTFRKRAMKSLLHFTHEATCALVCFGLEGIFLVPLGVLIEVEGDWHLLNLIEEIKHVYQERPKESWAILILFIVLTIVLIKLTHHYIPNKLFSKESERKDCLMTLEKNILEGRMHSNLKDILEVYYSCAINNNNSVVVNMEALNNLKLHEKPILEAYEILNNALWATNEKNIFMNDVVEISAQRAIE
jgi:hypothetical protein